MKRNYKTYVCPICGSKTIQPMRHYRRHHILNMPEDEYIWKVTGKPTCLYCGAKIITTQSKKCESRKFCNRVCEMKYRSKDLDFLRSRSKPRAKLKSYFIRGYNSSDRAIVYNILLEHEGNLYLKVGMTTRPKRRFKELTSGSEMHMVKLFVINTTLFNATLLETDILNCPDFKHPSALELSENCRNTSEYFYPEDYVRVAEYLESWMVRKRCTLWSSEMRYPEHRVRLKVNRGEEVENYEFQSI